MRLVFWGSQGAFADLTCNLPICRGLQLILTGALTGCTQTIVDNPIEVMKVRIITGDKLQHNIFNLDMYRGVIPTLSRNMVFASFFSLGIGLHMFDNDTKYTQFLQSACSGAVASIISHPFDVAKTASQRSGSDMVMNWRELGQFITHNSPKTLWSGCVARCILSCATMSIGYVTVNTLTSNENMNGYDENIVE